MSHVPINSGTPEEIAYRLWQHLTDASLSEDEKLLLYAKCLNIVKHPPRQNVVPPRTLKHYGGILFQASLLVQCVNNNLSVTCSDSRVSPPI